MFVNIFKCFEVTSNYQITVGHGQSDEFHIGAFLPDNGRKLIINI